MRLTEQCFALNTYISINQSSGQILTCLINTPRNCREDLELQKVASQNELLTFCAILAYSVYWLYVYPAWERDPPSFALPEVSSITSLLRLFKEISLILTGQRILYYCTDCKAPWGILVILGCEISLFTQKQATTSIQKTDWQWMNDTSVLGSHLYSVTVPTHFTSKWQKRKHRPGEKKNL